LRFEDLVSSPREVLEGLCHFLGLEFRHEMVEPYRNKERRMTDGIHPLSQMLGDVKFHQHSEIDSRVAKRWKERPIDDPLGEATWEMAHALGYERERATNSLLAAIQPQGQLPPFFCVHPVGGSPFCYLDLARHLGPEQPFYGFRARDLLPTLEPHTNVETMAADYIAAMRAVQPVGPYRLGGWSLGGIIAFEMARQLQAQGESVSTLALIDSFTPEMLTVNMPERHVDGASEESDDRTPLGKQDIMDALDELCRTGTEGEMKDSFETAKREGFLPPEVGPQEFQSWLMGCAARIRATRAYTPQPFGGRILLFKTSEQPGERPAENDEHLDPTLGWSGLAAEGVEVYSVPGSHQQMILEPYVSVLAAQLKRRLD
jgi:thioesterase domain-containing protein